MSKRAIHGHDEAAVTVLTPVYNGAAFLGECIDSVLQQSFTDFKYIIVNNRSTDKTLEVAQRYASKDNRIHVVNNDTFLSMPSNFNRAFSLVPPNAKYVKVVCADDWIMPTCIEELVRYLDEHPSVGIVGCHQQSDERVRWRDFPPEVDFLPGRQACRLALLTGLQLLGAPTSSLYRGDMIREGPFYPNENPHADTSACYEKLDHWDLGIVHRLLSVERVHDEQISTKIGDVSAGDLAQLETLFTYGPRYLEASEYAACFDEAYRAYCRGLGRGVLKFKGKKFWNYQRTELAKLGLELDYWLVLDGTLRSILANAAKPLTAGRKLTAAVSQRSGH